MNLGQQKRWKNFMSFFQACNCSDYVIEIISRCYSYDVLIFTCLEHCLQMIHAY